MPLSTGYEQLQPKYILGTDQGMTSVAEQMVGAKFDLLNQLREHLPFFSMTLSDRVVIPRAKSFGTASFVDESGASADDSITTLVDPAEEVKLASLAGTIDLAKYPIDLQSYSISQKELQREFKIIAVRILFWTQFFRSQTPDGFRGLPDLVAPDQVADLGNAALSLEALDELVLRVRESDTEMDSKVLVMPRIAFLKFARDVRTTGAPLTYGTRMGRRYATHLGVPILISDYIPIEDSPDSDDLLTTVWCMTLGFEHRGVFGVVPVGVGDNGLVVEWVQGARDTDSSVDRVRWYVSVILSQELGLASMTNVAVPRANL